MAARKTATKPTAYPKADSVAREASNQIVPVTKRHKVEVVEQRARKADDRQDKLRVLEDEMLAAALANTGHAMNFADIPFDLTEPPPELIAKYGADADRVFRMMKSSQMSAKDAPVGLLINQRMASAIIKARSSEKTKPSQLNIAVQVVVAEPHFEELEVE